MNNISKSLEIAKKYLNQEVEVIIDRPLGSKHPENNFVYEVNYGYIANTVSADNEELDAYCLGYDNPEDRITGICIAIAHRDDDDDDKLIIVPRGTIMSDKDIMKKIEFQEKWFKTRIVRS